MLVLFSWIACLMNFSMDSEESINPGFKPKVKPNLPKAPVANKATNLILKGTYS